jgi:predicted RNase H-like HicB family nuclease
LPPSIALIGGYGVNYSTGWFHPSIWNFYFFSIFSLWREGALVCYNVIVLISKRKLKGEEVKMAIPYTFWPAKEGGYIGYWNDYPDYLTEGETLGELEYMLRDLREGINVMISAGEIQSAIPCQSGMMEFA